MNIDQKKVPTQNPEDEEQIRKLPKKRKQNQFFLSSVPRFSEEHEVDCKPFYSDFQGILTRNKMNGKMSFNGFEERFKKPVMDERTEPEMKNEFVLKKSFNKKHCFPFQSKRFQESRERED